MAALLKRGGVSLEEAFGLRQEIAASLQRLASETQHGLEQRFKSLVEWTERETGVSPAIQRLRERLLGLESYLSDRRAPSAKRRRKAAKGRRAARHSSPDS